MNDIAHPIKLPLWRREGFFIPLLLILAFVPVLAGFIRFFDLLVNKNITEDNIRFFNNQIPIYMHVVSSILFAVLAPFQFSKSIRNKYILWHKFSGRCLMLFAMLSAISGIWMAIMYQFPKHDIELLQIIRIFVGLYLLMAVFISMYSIINHQIINHQNWMIRAYAVALGAGTQVFTHIPSLIFFEQPEGILRVILMTLGWVINIFIAEIIINKIKS